MPLLLLVHSVVVVGLPDLARGNRKGDGDGNGEGEGKSDGEGSGDGEAKGDIDGHGNGDGEGKIDGDGKGEGNGEGNGSPTCLTIRGDSGLCTERIVEGTLGGAVGCGS